MSGSSFFSELEFALFKWMELYLYVQFFWKCNSVCFFSCYAFFFFKELETPPSIWEQSNKIKERFTVQLDNIGMSQRNRCFYVAEQEMIWGRKERGQRISEEFYGEEECKDLTLLVQQATETGMVCTEAFNCQSS